ncbi:DUF1961 family protein [bacterium]|nr:DUF1961 family protein [bacterium]
MRNWTKDDLLYENPLASEADVRDFRMEGEACLTFPRERMRLENAHPSDPEKSRHGNYLLWCPMDFPADIAVSWEFLPRTDDGLAMFWMAAAGRQGEDLFDPSLAPRDGDYWQYHRGDINGFHVSYYRRNPSERHFQTCNLRKSHGFYLVAQGADPLPNSRDVKDFYQMEAARCGPEFRLSMNGLMVLRWHDDGQSFGPVLGGGKIGFRQMAGLIAEYRNLKVHAVRAT